MDLTGKTLQNLIWSGLELIGSSGIQFVVQLCLARLILPPEFGLIELLVIFLVLSQAIVDGGFTEALIQKKTLERIDISTAFFYNLLLSLLLYVVLYFSSPWVADFYEEPRLTVLMRVLSLSIIVSAFGAVNRAVLTRKLRFRKLFRVSLPSLVISGIAGIVAAYAGLGAWALVIYRLASVVVINYAYWSVTEKDERPRLEFSFSSMFQLQSYGLGMLGTSLFAMGTQNIYGLVIGKAFPIGQLAFYNRSRQFHRVPVQTVTGVLSRVLFPVFSNIQHNNDKILRAVRSGLPVVIFFIAPMMFFLMAASETIVVLLLTETWLPSAALMAWFPLTGITFAIAAIQLSVIRAKGFSNLFFVMSVIRNSVALVVLYYTVKQGLMAIIIGQVAVSYALHSMNMYASKYVFGYGIRDQLIDVVPYILVAAFSSVYVILLEQLNIRPLFLLAVCQGSVFIAVYLSTSYFFNLSALKSSQHIFGKLKRMKEQKEAKAALLAGNEESVVPQPTAAAEIAKAVPNTNNGDVPTKRNSISDRKETGAGE